MGLPVAFNAPTLASTAFGAGPNVSALQALLADVRTDVEFARTARRFVSNLAIGSQGAQPQTSEQMIIQNGSSSGSESFSGFAGVRNGTSRAIGSPLSGGHGALTLASAEAMSRAGAGWVTSDKIVDAKPGTGRSGREFGNSSNVVPLPPAGYAGLVTLAGVVGVAGVRRRLARSA